MEWPCWDMIKPVSTKYQTAHTRKEKWKIERGFRRRISPVKEWAKKLIASPSGVNEDWKQSEWEVWVLKLRKSKCSNSWRGMWSYLGSAFNWPTESNTRFRWTTVYPGAQRNRAGLVESNIPTDALEPFLVAPKLRVRLLTLLRPKGVRSIQDSRSGARH